MSTDNTHGNGNNDDQESVIKYPCEFPIKAMGKNGTQLEIAVLEIIHRHDTGLREGSIKSRPSSNGKYLSITVTISAQNRAQLDAIYQDLTDCEHVLMAL